MEWLNHNSPIDFYKLANTGIKKLLILAFAILLFILVILYRNNKSLPLFYSFLAILPLMIFLIISISSTKNIRFISKRSNDVIRFSLFGYRIDYKLSRPVPIRLGGSKEDDDIWIRGLSSHFLEISYKDSNLAMSQEKQKKKGTGIVKVDGEFLNTTLLKENDKLHITIWPNKQKRTFVLKFVEGDQIHSEQPESKNYFVIPKRTYKASLIGLKIPSRTYFTYSEKIYPLRNIFQKIYDTRVPAMKSFIFFKRNRFGFAEGPYLALLDKFITLNQSISFDPIYVADKTHFSLQVYKVSQKRNDYYLTRAANFKEVSHLSTENKLQFIKASPQNIGFRSSMLMDSSKKGYEKFLIACGETPFSTNSWYINNLSEHFSDILGYLQILPTVEGKDIDNADFILYSGIKRLKLNFNDTFRLGDAHQLLLRVNDYSIPWWIFFFFLGFALIKFVAWEPVYRTSRVTMIALVVVDFILALRVLFAYKAYAHPPFSDGALVKSCLAALVIPFLLTFIWLITFLYKRSLSQSDIHCKVVIRFTFFALFSTITTLFILYKSQSPYLYYFTLTAYLLSILLSWIAYYKMDFMRATFIKGTLDNLIDRISPLNLSLVILATLIIRITLVFLGYKEAINIGGQRIALSILYTPLIIFIVAAVFHLISRELNKNSSSWNEKNIYWGVFLVYFILVFNLLGISAVASDWGIFLLLAPPIAISLVLFCPKLVKANKWSVVFFLLPMFSFFLFLSFPRGITLFTYNILKGESVGAAYNACFPTDEDLVQYDQNILRVIQLVAPELIQEIGVKNTEALAQHMETMRSYARRGWGGEGYLATRISPNLYKTSLNDNVPSVFLMAEFGIAGTIGLLLVQCLLFAPILLSPKAVNYPDCWQYMSVLTAGILFYACFYMVGANAVVFPFSGKNIYLLGLDSFSDIAEATILYGLYVFSSSYPRGN